MQATVTLTSLEAKMGVPLGVKSPVAYVTSTTLEKLPTVEQVALTGMVVLATVVALTFNNEPVV